MHAPLYFAQAGRCCVGLCSCRLVNEGFNPTYGARPLRRAIMRLIEDCLAERILAGDIKVRPADCTSTSKQSDHLLVVFAGGTLTFLVWPAWILGFAGG